jgi:hypothetical protein
LDLAARLLLEVEPDTVRNPNSSFMVARGRLRAHANGFLVCTCG